MASCSALNCTFVDQFQTYLIQLNEYDVSWWKESNGSNGSSYSPPEPPSPPIIIADPDIAGLGVFALILLHLCKSLNHLSGHSRLLIICLCYLDRGCYWLWLRIHR